MNTQNRWKQPTDPSGYSDEELRQMLRVERELPGHREEGVGAINLREDFPIGSVVSWVDRRGRRMGGEVVGYQRTQVKVRTGSVVLIMDPSVVVERTPMSILIKFPVGCRVIFRDGFKARHPGKVIGYGQIGLRGGGSLAYVNVRRDSGVIVAVHPDLLYLELD